MMVMVFEFEVASDELDAYLHASTELRTHLSGIEGFISVERFASSTKPGRFVAIGYFADEAAVARWRNLPEHRRTQALGRTRFFTGYRLVMAEAKRDYSHKLRDQAPQDSRLVHDGGEHFDM